MTTKYLLVSIFPLKEPVVNIELMGLESHSKKKYYTYSSNDNNELLELRAFSSLADLNDIENELNSELKALASYLNSDVRRELLSLIDDPLEKSDQDIPNSRYVQLRHIEVLPEKYSEYRKWRDGSIFQVVRDNSSIISSFGAYHSFISGQPGVMFVSLFDNEQAHHTIFNDKRYKKILVEAGDKYIISGTEKGLYTKTYVSTKNLVSEE